MSSSYEVKNAIVTSAEIMYEDHGIMVLSLTLDYGGSCQGFGGYRLDTPEAQRGPSANGADQIARILDVAGVGRWRHVVGKTIRAYCRHNGILAIGHIINDRWYCPRKDFRNMITLDEVKRVALAEGGAL